MSDFDKEKERERLREKYEHDQEKRETAEKMSELLLQGATMTNAHCSECGDPIFRYDGQEFCATCERPVDRGSDDEGADEEADGEDGAATGAEGTADDSETIEVTSPSDEGRVRFGGEADGADPGAGETAPGRRREEPPAPAADGTESAGTPDPSAPQSDRRGIETDHEGSSRPPAPAGDGVPAARESLVRTLSRFSEAAERCEDPQRAREYLAAAREAAETLAALRR